MYFGGQLRGDKDLEGVKPRTLEEKMVAEGFWDSNYYEPDRWIRDMASDGFSLIGVYDVDGDIELYRFELDESKRGEAHETRTMGCHFQNVSMRKSNKEYTDKVNENIAFMMRIKK